MLTEYFKGKILNKQVDPDYVTVYGAAQQAFILSSQVPGIESFCCIFDVTIFDLGLVTKGGVCNPILPRNTTIPG
jgi:L1 cell adhesion molecule like protein